MGGTCGCFVYTPHRGKKARRMALGAKEVGPSSRNQDEHGTPISTKL